MANEQTVLFLTKFDADKKHEGMATSVHGVLRTIDRDSAVALLDGTEELHVIDGFESGTGATSLYRGGSTVAFELPTEVDDVALVLADVQMFAIMTAGFLPLTWEGEQTEDGLSAEMLLPGYLTYAPVNVVPIAQPRSALAQVEAG